MTQFLSRRDAMAAGAAGITVAAAAPTAHAATASGFATLTASATPLDHLRANPKPRFAAGTRLPRLLRFDFGTTFDTNEELARAWGYSLPVKHDYDIIKDWGFSDDELAFMRLAKTDPTTYKLAVSSISYNVYFNTPRPHLLARLPAGVFLRDAAGKQFTDNDGNPLYWLSPLVPESALRLAGGDANYALQQIAARAPISYIYDRGEWGMQLINAGVDTNYARDPRVVAAMAKSGDPASYYDWWAYLSRSAASIARRLRGYATAGLPSGIPYIYYTQGFGPERGRWGGFRDASWDFTITRGAFSTYVGNEGYYLGGNSGWTGIWDGLGFPYDLLTTSLNAIGGQIALGSPLSYNWLSPGWYQPEPNPYNSVPDLYMGYLKCMYTAGQIGAVAGNFYFDKPLTEGAPVGAQPSIWVWGWITLAHAHALFSKLQRFLFAGDLLPGPNLHPFQNRETLPPHPAYEFPCEGEIQYVPQTYTPELVAMPTARVLARRLRAGGQFLVTAWANTGNDRDVATTIPELGRVVLRARRAGSVYVFRQNAAGGYSGVLQDPNPMFPTAI